MTEDVGPANRDTIDPNKLKIYPSIGVARVGNSTDPAYLPPAKPGGLPTTEDYKTEIAAENLRGRDRKLRRQAAAFQVFYEKDSAEPVCLGPESQIEGQTIESIEWQVHLANKKPVWYEFRAAAGEHGYSVDHPLRNADVTDETARKALILDPGPKTVTCKKGVREQTTYLAFRGRKLHLPGESFWLSSLGRIVGRGDGFLWVLGGAGLSGSKEQKGTLANYANNDGWWDDVSDGPVTATITFKDKSTKPVKVPLPSWVVVGPPAYAPQLTALVTLYDTLYDVFVRKLPYNTKIFKDKKIFENNQWKLGYLPAFESEIKPLLERASKYPAVVAIPPKVHTFDWDKLKNPEEKYRQLREYYVEALRPPDKQNTLASPTTGYRTMPYMAGDDSAGETEKAAKFLTLTPTQYFLFRQWGKGKFVNGSSSPGSSPSSEHLGEQWTIATLSNCPGGAFGPGIEVGWLCRNEAIYLEKEFFRFKPVEKLPEKAGELHLARDFTQGLEPGDITMFMALPWQSDFNQCTSQLLDDHFLWWWPTERPLFVYARREDPPKAGGSPPLKDEDRWEQVTWVGSARDQTSDDYVMLEDSLDMVKHWPDMGFVVTRPTGDPWKGAPEHIEIRRTYPRPGFKTDYQPSKEREPQSDTEPARETQPTQTR